MSLDWVCQGGEREGLGIPGTWGQASLGLTKWVVCWDWDLRLCKCKAPLVYETLRR